MEHSLKRGEYVTAIFYQMGMFTLFVLGSVTSWRASAGIVAVIPVFTILLLIKVSEHTALHVVRSLQCVSKRALQL
jgi:hypothetical protein